MINSMKDMLHNDLYVGDNVIISGPQFDTMCIGVIDHIDNYGKALVRFMNGWNCTPPSKQERWRTSDKMIKVDADAVLMYHLKNAEKGNENA